MPEQLFRRMEKDGFEKKFSFHSKQKIEDDVSGLYFHDTTFRAFFLQFFVDKKREVTIRLGKEIFHTIIENGDCIEFLPIFENLYELSKDGKSIKRVFLNEIERNILIRGLKKEDSVEFFKCN